jgi:hypothetical protein
LLDFKIYVYVNSHADMLFEKRKRVGWFFTVGVVMRRDDGCETVVKENDDGGWSFDGVVLNDDAVEW